MNKKELKWFSELILQQPRFGGKQMAIRWMAGVDGENIFPKVPAQLKEYFVKWERNQRIQDAMKGIKNTTERLASFIRNTAVPATLRTPTDETATASIAFLR
jgi:hypothetical protein